MTQVEAEKQAFLKLRDCGLILKVTPLVGGVLNVFTASDPLYWVEFKLNVQVDSVLNPRNHQWANTLNQ